MKTISCRALRPHLTALAAVTVLVGCAAPRTERTAETPVYETADQIRAMPPCRAKVVQREPCSIRLQTPSGTGFYLGGPGSKADVTRFLSELMEGEVYAFPAVFLEHGRRTQEP